MSRCHGDIPASPQFGHASGLFIVLARFRRIIHRFATLATGFTAPIAISRQIEFFGHV